MKLKLYTPDHSIRLVDTEEYHIAKHVYGSKAVILGLPVGNEPESPKPILVELLYTGKGKVLTKKWIKTENGPGCLDYS